LFYSGYVSIREHIFDRSPGIIGDEYARFSQQDRFFQEATGKANAKLLRTVEMPMMRRRNFIVLLLFPEPQKRFLDSDLDVM
jgi:hypothetical protein